jgi:zinc transport system permease protein
MFEYLFMQKALIAGLAIAISAALLGTSLVLRRNSMIGDGLSHVSFGAIAIAVALGLAPLAVAIPVAILTSILLLSLNEKHKVGGDSAIAVISAVSLAAGVVAVSLSGTNIDINSYMFGSILALSNENLILSLALLAITIVFFVKFYQKIFALTFDETFARAIGIKVKTLNIAFAALSSVVIVLGMKLLGVLLISSLIVFPNISAKYLTKSFRGLTIMSVCFAAAAFVLGLILSYLLNIPTGASVVLVNFAIFLAAKFIAKK